MQTRTTSLSQLLWLATLALTVGGFLWTLAHAEPAPLVTAIPTVRIDPTSLPPIDSQPTFARLRAEAFRAGLQEGLAQQGCTASLSFPLSQP